MTRAEQIRNAVFEMTGPFTGEDVCRKLYFTEGREKTSVVQELKKMCFQFDILDIVKGDSMYSLKTVYKHKKEEVKKDSVEPKKEDLGVVVSKLSNKEITRYIAEGMTEVFHENDQLKKELEALRKEVKETDGLKRELTSKIKEGKELKSKFDELITERHDLVQRDSEHCRTIRSLKDELLKADEEINGLRKQVSELARFNRSK